MLLNIIIMHHIYYEILTIKSLYKIRVHILQVDRIVAAESCIVSVIGNYVMHIFHLKGEMNGVEYNSHCKI